jgi:hypothetical protein
VGLCAVTVGCALATLHELAPSQAGRWLGYAGIAAIPTFYAWAAVTLMDLGLWATTIALSLRALAAESWSTARRARWLAGTCALAVLTRPEAMAVAPALAVLFILAEICRGSSSVSARRPPSG